MATYEEMRDKGFIDVDLYGIGDIHRFCMENRLIPNEIYKDVDSLIYSNRKTPIVISDKRLLGEEWEFKLFRIGVKREIMLVNDTVPEWILKFSENERSYERERTKRSRAAKGKRGGYLGGYVPYGYYNINKKLYVDDYESFVVKFVFYRYLNGCSINGIAKELNLRGFVNRKDKPFGAGSIDGIIKNKRLYQGYTTFDGEEVKGDYRPILEESSELLTKEWKERVFDSATEARISEHRKKHHSENSVPHEIRPYILVGTEPKKKGRRDVWK